MRIIVSNFTVLFFLSLNAHALVGVDALINSMQKNNQHVLSLEKNIESKQALSDSLNSAYYPTLNAVGGYGHNKTDDLPTVQQGYLGYIEGKLNIFNGFKDQSLAQQNDIELEISKIELESKKRELRLELTDILSQMILLHKVQAILGDEYKVTQTQKKMASKKVSAGLTGSVDNLEFELRENEIQIEQKQIEQQHLEAHQKLIKIFGENINDSMLEKIDFSLSSGLMKTSNHLNIENNLDYKKIKLAQVKTELEKTEIKSDFLPTLDFTYSMGRITPSEEAPAKFNESKYAIQLTIPLFSGFDTYYKTHSASASILAFEKIKSQKLNDISSDFNILKTKISEMSALYQINEKKLAGSQKYFDLTLSEYKRGVKNSPDLVSATERLFSAQKKKYEILKELEISKVKIENYN